MKSAKGTSAAIFLRATLPVFLVVLVLGASFGCQQLFGQRAKIPALSGAEIFKEKCGKCHDREIALKKYRSPELWRETINRMKTQHHADVSQKEIDLLVKYHIERQQQEAAVFEEKCQRCHPGKVFLEQSLTPDQARGIIKRMQQKAGNTIEDKDVEIIVRYHAWAQKTNLDSSLDAVSDALKKQPGMEKGMKLFLQKCSRCHSPSRALAVIKDPEVWAKTIKRMQDYSKGDITDAEARELVDFHVNRQQKEIDTFQQTCTKCHSDERINSRSMTEEQWLQTIKRMQQKAPALITDEKVNLLAAYFHRRELTMARLFYGKCGLCHNFTAGNAYLSGSTKQMDGLIALANEEFAKSLRINDVHNLVSIHLQRQQRIMQLYESNCTTCHPAGSLQQGKGGQILQDKRTRAQWITFIAAVQDVELTKDSQNAINSQIDYHISRH